MATLDTLDSAPARVASFEQLAFEDMGPAMLDPLDEGAGFEFDSIHEGAGFEFDSIHEGEDAYAELLGIVARLAAAASAGEAVTLAAEVGEGNLMIGDFRRRRGVAFLRTSHFEWGGADD